MIGRPNETIASDGPKSSRIARRLGQAAVCAALSAVVLAAFARGWPLADYLGMRDWWDRLLDGVLSVFELLWAPPLPLLFWIPAVAWSLVEAIKRCSPWAEDRLTAFDAVALSWSKVARFLCYCSALVALCVCALPTFFVAGLVVCHARLMGLP